MLITLAVGLVYGSAPAETAGVFGQEKIVYLRTMDQSVEAS